MAGFVSWATHGIKRGRFKWNRRRISGALGVAVELSLATAAGLGVYVLYSRIVRLPELPRSVDLFRSAIRGR